MLSVEASLAAQARLAESKSSGGLPVSKYELQLRERALDAPLITRCAVEGCGWRFEGTVRGGTDAAKLHRRMMHPERPEVTTPVMKRQQQAQAAKREAEREYQTAQREQKRADREERKHERDAAREQRRQEQASVLGPIVQSLREHGPMTAADLAALLQVPMPKLGSTLAAMVRHGGPGLPRKLEDGTHWGLPDQSMKDIPLPPETMRCIEVLRDHGPRTASALAASQGVNISSRGIRPRMQSAQNAGYDVRFEDGKWRLEEGTRTAV